MCIKQKMFVVGYWMKCIESICPVDAIELTFLLIIG